MARWRQRLGQYTLVLQFGVDGTNLFPQVRKLISNTPSIPAPPARSMAMPLPSHHRHRRHLHARRTLLNGRDFFTCGGLTPTIQQPTNAIAIDDFQITFTLTNPPPPIANFSGSPTSGSIPLTVSFTNLSTAASTYAWDFGDGNHSSGMNPSNTYSNAGIYSVTLSAIGLGGTNVITLTNYILATNPHCAAGHRQFFQLNRPTALRHCSWPSPT